MKKILYFTLITILALVSASCAREEFPTNHGFAPGETGLVLRVRSSAPETRLVPAPTELNEDRLEYFYYFLYAVNPAENTTTAPVYVGKWTAPEGTTVTGIGTEENITLDKLAALAVSETKYAGYVYVIANYKDAETLAAWNAIIASSAPDYSNLTYENLQNLSLPATFQSYNIVGGDEIMNEKADEGHRFKPQDSFVMDCEPTAFEVTKGEVGEITAPLTRLAAKISLEIDMAKWYIQMNKGEYKYTWYSDPSRVQVYLNYAADKGTMDGEPITYIANGENANTGDFFTYRRFAFLSDWTKNDDGEYVFPDGSYTEREAYRWIYKEDAAATQPESDGNYYTSDEEQDDMVVVVDGKVVEKDAFNRPAYKITGTPFYSYPYDFSGDSGHAPFFKVIVEWTAYTETDSETTHRATDTQEGTKDIPQIIAHEFYYKITIPEIKIFEANNWYKIGLHLSTLGSEADETSIDVSSDTYFVTNWGDPDDPEVPSINAGLYLNVAKDVYDMYSSSLEIPVSASGAIKVTAFESNEGNPAGTYPLATGNTITYRSLTYSTSSSTGTNFKVTPDVDNTFVKVEHTVEPFSTSFSADNGNAKDIAIITYKLRISLDGHPEFYKDVTVNQYPSIYVQRKQSRGNPYVNGIRGNTINNANGYTLGPIGNDAGTRSTYFTTVSISTLTGVSSTYPNWVIGDPRIRLADAYNGTFQGDRSYNVYTTSNESTEWRRTDLGSAPDYFDKYLVGVKESSNVIAPKFMLATGYGYRSSLTNSTWKSNAERCATYQEDGYPAGRWRLPTEAEVLFCATLASHGLIESPFVNNTRYWAASGGNLQYTTNGSNWTFNYTYNQGTVSVRCVYDVWYWGDDPVDRVNGNPTTMLPE